MSWLLVRHFALTELEDELEAGGTSSLVALSEPFLNESCDSDAEDELLSGLVDDPGTTRGTKLSVLQMMVFPVFGHSWLLTADPLSGVSVVFCKACLAIGLQAFHRDYERTLVPPRGFALSRLQSTLL